MTVRAIAYGAAKEIPMSYAIGTSVRHKTNMRPMVVTEKVGEYLNCRYENPVTGKYDLEAFRPEELVLLATVGPQPGAVILPK
jgi:hypothetical protein